MRARATSMSRGRRAGRASTAAASWRCSSGAMTSRRSRR
jgi:hypothetical protein